MNELLGRYCIRDHTLLITPERIEVRAGQTVDGQPIWHPVETKAWLPTSPPSFTPATE